MTLKIPLETAWGRGFAEDDPIVEEVEQAADEIGWKVAIERIPHAQGGFAVAVPLFENSLDPDTINWLHHNGLVVAWRDTDPEHPRRPDMVNPADTLVIMAARSSHKRTEPNDAA